MLSHDARFTIEKLTQRLALIEGQVHREALPLPPFRHQVVGRAATHAEALAGLRDDGWTTIAPRTYWGEWETDFVLRTELTVPAEWQGDAPLSLVLKVGDAGDFIHPEALVRIDGERIGACDRYHEELRLPAKFADGQPHELELHGWTGLGGRLARGPEGRQLFMGESVAARPDETLRAFVASARVVLGTAGELAGDDIARGKLLGALDRAFIALDTRDPIAEHLPASVAGAQEVLDAALAEITPGTTARIHAAGHAHIDLAWLWSTKQTRLKGTRTFSTVDALMMEFPDYKFSQSQPQLYDWMKTDDPEIYERIKARVDEGRWEPTGGMWVEADCNLSGAESLARQFLLGRQFYRQEFGKDRDTPILWLPDVFGYAWSLPQLIKAAGLEYFFTIKIGWNQYNRMPFDSFWWQGLDGTRVLTHFSTTPGDSIREISTYNAHATAKQMVQTWTNFQQKDTHDDLFMSFGYGDGGGGPTRGMLENIREMGKLPVGPDVRHSTGAEFFEALETDAGDRLPVWDGELYLEYHRGTYTTQARNKRNNRKAEFALHDAELLSSMALVAGGFDYPAEEFDRLWKLVCLNQFHDIIPGTSINEVYRHSDAEYADIFASVAALRDAALAALGGGDGVLLVNPTDFARTDTAFAEGLPEGAVLTGPDGIARATQAVEGGALIDARGLGPLAALRCAVGRGDAPDSDLSVSKTHLENAFLRVEIDAAGDIVRLHDKRANREILREGEVANRLLGFEDRPMNWDAWDIDAFYEDKQWQAEPATSVEVVEEGPLRAALRITRRFMSSEIVQTVSLGTQDARLDFATRVDWQERHMMLKAAFPLDVLSPTATFDIQWGNVERPTHRNTSWDWARFESCAHKWVDLSEGDYGVSLLNDCKYGHDVQGSTLRLTLLRSPTHPDPEADRGTQVFTYSLFPHEGRWGRDTIAAAYALNDPVIVHRGGSGAGEDALAPLVASDNPNVVIETVKRAEDGQGIVVRLYETRRTRGTVTLTAGFDLGSACTTNLLEDAEDRLEVDGRSVTLPVRPFQIVTVRLVPKG